MGRIRTVKPEFFIHEGIFDAEMEAGLPLRLAYIGLWTQCDREGRFDWRPRTLKATIMPHDDIDFSRVLDALASREFVVRYASNGSDYGLIPTFPTHQVINNRESDSSRPDPDASDCEYVTSTREARVDHATVTPVKRKGKEGKGKEGKGRERKDAIDAVVAHYQELHPRSRPGADERRKISDRLDEGYSVADLQAAIDGCHRSPYHSGLNDQNTKYQKLSLIVRDSSQVQQFMEIPEKPRLLGKGDERRIRTEMAGQRWLNQGNEENDEGNRQAPLLP